VVITVTVVVIVSIPAGGMALFVFAPFYFMALLVAGAQILASRHDKRCRGQLKPGARRAARRSRVSGTAGPVMT
jgi:hypothetical protein